MENTSNSKSLRLTAAITTYVLVAVFFFLIGLFAGRMGKEPEIVSENMPKAESVSVNSLIEEKAGKTYQVKIQGTKLYMYEIEEGKITTLAECEISERVYPDDDINELKTGIDFKEKNEAQAMFENFSS